MNNMPPNRIIGGGDDKNVSPFNMSVNGDYQIVEDNIKNKTF
jgi:hypothetical protein